MDGEVEPTVEIHGEAGSQNGGPPPGVPIAPKPTVRLEPDQVVAAAQPGVCVPCLIGRGVVLLLITGVLVYMVIQDRKKAKGESK